MTKSNPLQLKAKQTTKFLDEQGLITKEHALTIALLDALCEEWQNANSSTQRGGISKEIRACLEILPKPEVKQTDDVSDFFTDLENA